MTILWVALAVVGGVCLFVLYRVTGIIRQIIVFGRREKLPKQQLNHPDLGLMTFDSGIWTADCESGGRRFQCYISGTQDGPAVQLVNSGLRVIRDIDRYRELALDFLVGGTPREQLMPGTIIQIDRKAFQLDSVNCLWERQPDNFNLEFNLEGDPDGMWRVEFQDGKPVFTGRDD